MPDSQVPGSPDSAEKSNIREERGMRAVTVYRVDYVQKTKVPIGWVMERQRTARSDNDLGLLGPPQSRNRLWQAVQVSRILP